MWKIPLRTQVTKLYQYKTKIVWHSRGPNEEPKSQKDLLRKRTNYWLIFFFTKRGMFHVATHDLQTINNALLYVLCFNIMCCSTIFVLPIQLYMFLNVKVINKRTALKPVLVNSSGPPQNNTRVTNGGLCAYKKRRHQNTKNLLHTKISWMEWIYLVSFILWQWHWYLINVWRQLEKDCLTDKVENIL